MNSVLRILPLILLSLLMACGKAKPMPEFGHEAQVVATNLPLDGSNIKGRYKVEFITLNTEVNGYLTTSGLIDRQEDNLQIGVKLANGAPHVWHKQDIYTGRRCPTPNDDLNKDGLIDIQEGEKAWGKPLIPLDANLKSQSLGKNKYPMANEQGTYTYKRSTNFEELFEDLRKAPEDGAGFAKLPENEGLPLEGNILVILGADFNAALPETVATLEGLDRHQSFPVACGLITKISDEPGTWDPTEIGSLGNPDAPRPGPTLPLPEPAPGPLPVPTPDPLPSPNPPLPDTIPTPVPRPEPIPVPAPAPSPVPNPEPRPDTGDYEDDEDDDDWEVRVRRWWRRTWNGGGGDN